MYESSSIVRVSQLKETAAETTSTAAIFLNTHSNPGGSFLCYTVHTYWYWNRCGPSVFPYFITISIQTLSPTASLYLSMIAATVTFYNYHLSLNHLYSLMHFPWLHSDSEERWLVEILTGMRSNPSCHSRTQNSSCALKLLLIAIESCWVRSWSRMHFLGLQSGQNAEMLLHSGILCGLTFSLGVGSCHRMKSQKWRYTP